MRSLLFVPGDSERMLEKGCAAGADAVIVDFEDSVAADRKAAARSITAAFLASEKRPVGLKVYVRVNDLGSGMTDDDLDSVICARPDGIMLPKAEGIGDVDRLSVKLRVREAEAGLVDGAIRILPIITETAAGVFAAPSFSAGSNRLAGLTWGAEDLSAAIGASATRDASGRFTGVFQLARATTVLAAAVAGTSAIDTVFVDFRDQAGLRAECAEAERDGFTGKLAIHPAQVEVINAVFTPSPEAIDAAHALVDAFAAAGNPGVIGLGGKMYDRPHLRRAQQLLTRAVRSPVG